MIERSALNGCDVSDVILQYDHSGKVLARQSNKTLIIETDDHGLFICADLSKSQAAKEMYEEIANGLVTRMSFAFSVAEDEYDRENHTRIIKRLKKIFDVSSVSLPANADTEISARSYLDGVFEIEKQEMLLRKKQILKLKTILD